MRVNKPLLFRLGAVFSVSALALTACGDGDAADAEDDNGGNTAEAPEASG